MMRVAKAVCCLLAILLVSGMGATARAKEKKRPAQEASVDQKAVGILGKSCKALADLKAYAFTADVTLDKVYGDGSKVQSGRRMEVQVLRPGAFRVATDGDDLQLLSVFDGKTFTLSLPDRKAFGQVQAPMETDALMDYLASNFGIESVLGDLLSNTPCARMTPGSSYYVGKAKVDGAVCDHLFFQGKDVDWQIWIEDSGAAFPRKIVITEKKLAASPQFSAVLTGWKTGGIGVDAFAFVPPADFARDDAIITGQKSAKK